MEEPVYLANAGQTYMPFQENTAVKTLSYANLPNNVWVQYLGSTLGVTAKYGIEIPNEYTTGDISALQMPSRGPQFQYTDSGVIINY